MLIFLSGNRPLGQNRTDYLSSFFLQVAPALYTHKVAHKKAIEKQQERIANLQLKLQTDGKIDMDDMSANNETNEDPVRKKKFIFGIFLRGLTKFQEFVHRNLNLIQLLTPMLLQDGPFLIVRLVLVAYYKVTGMIWKRLVQVFPGLKIGATHCTTSSGFTVLFPEAPEPRGQLPPSRPLLMGVALPFSHSD